MADFRSHFSMRPLFSPDKFSFSTISYTSVDSSLYSFISSILLLFYSRQICSLPISISQVGTLEINSNNFLVKTSEHSFLLKRIPSTRDLALLTHQLECSQVLTSAGVSFPLVYNASNDLPYVTYSDSIWILFQYCSGNYFSGRVHQLIPCAYNIGKLFDFLTSYQSTYFTPIAYSPSLFNHFESSYQRLFDCRDHWDSIFTYSTYEMLNNSLHYIDHSFSFVQMQKPLFLGSTLSTCHIDLHPHNLLFSQRAFSSFLDFESLQLANSNVSLAFSIFKLLRQFAVVNSSSLDQTSFLPNALDSFLLEVAKSFSISRSTLSSFPAYALYEVLRRLFVITDLNILKHDRRWDCVLDIQLLALQEIPVVFESLTC